MEEPIRDFDSVVRHLADHARRSTPGYGAQSGVVAYFDAQAYVEAHWPKGAGKRPAWWTGLWDAHERGEAVEVGQPYAGG